MVAFLVCAIACVPIAFYGLRIDRKWWFLDPINTFWPVFVLFGVVQAWYSRAGWLAVYGEATVYWTLSLYIIGGVCVCFGYRARPGPFIGRTLPVLRGREDRSRWFRIGVITLLLGLCAYAYVIRNAGGLEVFLSSSRLNVSNIDQLTIGAYVAYFVPLIPMGLMILLCTTFSDRRYVLTKRLVLGGMGAWTFWNVYAGTRSGFISAVVLLFGAVYGAKRRNPSPAVMIGALSAVVVIVGFITQYRGDFYGGHFNVEHNSSQVLDRSIRMYTTAEGDSVPLGSEFGMSLAVVEYVPSQVPYDLGYMLLELFTAPIPRGIWPDKIYPSGKSWDQVHRVARTGSWINAAGYLSGPAPGFVGKWFYMAGPLGVVIGGLWTGMFLQVVRTYTARYPGIAGTVLAVNCAMLGFSEMNNPLSWPVGWLPSSGVFAFVLVALSRRHAVRRYMPRGASPALRAGSIWLRRQT